MTDRKRRIALDDDSDRASKNSKEAEASVNPWTGLPYVEAGVRAP